MLKVKSYASYRPTKRSIITRCSHSKNTTRYEIEYRPGKAINHFRDLPRDLFKVLNDVEDVEEQEKQAQYKSNDRDKRRESNPDIECRATNGNAQEAKEI
jgi:hypothetical protein